MKVLLTANGLADQVPYTALAQKTLQSNVNDPKSLANKLTDTRWKPVVQTYDFANKGLSVIQDPKVISTIANAYAEVTWRKSLDATTPGLSNALTFRKQASTISSVDQILGDPVMRKVVTTALGIPLQIAFQPLEAQEKAISTRLDITQVQGPEIRRELRPALSAGGDTIPQAPAPRPTLTSLAVQARVSSSDSSPGTIGSKGAPMEKLQTTVDAERLTARRRIADRCRASGRCPAAARGRAPACTAVAASGDARRLGWQCVKDGLDLAQSELDRPWRNRPNMPDLRKCRADLRMQMDDKEGAAADAAEAVILDRSDPAAKALLGVLMLELRRPADAVACLAEAVAAEPANPAYREGLAAAQEASGDADAALATLDRRHRRSACRCAVAQCCHPALGSPP